MKFHVGQTLVAIADFSLFNIHEASEGQTLPTNDVLSGEVLLVTDFRNESPGDQVTLLSSGGQLGWRHTWVLQRWVQEVGQ